MYLANCTRPDIDRLSDFLLKSGYENNEDCPCVFIRKSQKGFCIISVYVDDLNIIGYATDVEEASAYVTPLVLHCKFSTNNTL